MSQRVGAPTSQPGFLLRIFPAMEYLEYRRMFYAAGLSAISLWAMITARGWLAYDLTGSPSGTGIVTFAAIGPWVLAPIGGALADRFDRAKIVMLSRVGAALCALILAYLAFSGALAMWNLVLVTLFSGIIRSAEMPAQQALLPNTIKMHALLSAVTMASMMQFGSKVIGPVAGPVIKNYGAEWVFVATAMLLALSIYQMTRMTTRSTGGIAGSTNGIMRDTVQNVRVGLRYLGRAPSVRLMIVMVSLHCMFTMAFDFSLLPAYADLILGGGQAEYGYLLMAIGGGAFASTIVLSMMPAGRVRGRVFLVVGVFSGLSLIWVGVADTMLLALIGGAMAGASQAMFMALTSAMIQAVLPDSVRGRVMSLYMMFAGGIMAVMILANGLAADYISIRILLIGPGIIFALIMIAALVLPRIRSVIRNGGIVEEGRRMAQEVARTAAATAGAALRPVVLASRPAPQRSVVEERLGSGGGGGGGGG